MVIFKTELLLYISKCLLIKWCTCIVGMESSTVLLRHNYSHLYCSCMKIEIPLALAANEVGNITVRVSDFFCLIMITWMCQKSWKVYTGSLPSWQVTQCVLKCSICLGCSLCVLIHTGLMFLRIDSTGLNINFDLISHAVGIQLRFWD